ncbi:MAG TPA: zinc ribbon domain-containing protein [Thermomicrobiales bacterium]|nr:zinc ribbon domain-containing protein [Thermomicrobiales bacterium]
MPVYEYVCASCGRKTSVFYRSFAATGEPPECPRCGRRELERRMSRVWTRRASGRGGDTQYSDPSFEHEGIPFYGGDESMLDEMQYLGEDGSDSDGDDEDVAALAREARAMSSMMGEPLDADLDEALYHVERGADPDDVFGEMDARAPEIADNDA